MHRIITGCLESAIILDFIGKGENQRHFKLLNFRKTKWIESELRLLSSIQGKVNR